MYGRALGVGFAIPAVYFAMRSKIPRFMYGRLAGMFALGGLQGVVGWWMVKSGLEEELLHKAHEPRVSPYRLATHVRHRAAHCRRY
jgi:cytochrome c oxidase assembly protein subunit 15